MALVGNGVAERRAAGAASPTGPGLDAAEAWALIRALRERRDSDRGASSPGDWALRLDGPVWVDAADRPADVVVTPGTGELHWRRRRPDHEARAILELHAELALRTRQPGHVMAILGQSLDGFIATRDGQSRYINGEESLVHLHRLRSLSDAVLVGIGTVLADEPRLTTRHVAGGNAVRVVLDPRGRLPAAAGLLHDGAAPTIVVRGGGEVGMERRLTDQAVEIRLPLQAGSMAPTAVVAALASRGLGRVLIEGGGVTVGRFVDAGLVDRVQLAVSPVILGSGRPALPIAPAARLEHAMRPTCRSFGLGGDVLFDLRLDRAVGDAAPERDLC